MRATANSGTVHRLVLRLRDDDGQWTGAGDTVQFAYGIPPVRVDANIIERDCQLLGLCPGHNPPEFNLRSLRRYVGNWYKQKDGISIHLGSFRDKDDAIMARENAEKEHKFHKNHGMVA